MHLAVALTMSVCAGAGQTVLSPVDVAAPPVAAVVDGYKVYKYGEFDVYEVSPTYDEGLTIQKGNGNAWRKLRPKKSWEIATNLLGLTPTRMPSSRAAEWEPYATVFFADGNPDTTGYAGCPVGDPSITRAWVRIDFPRPVKVGSVRIVSRPDGAGMPLDFDIRAFHWDLWQTNRDAEDGAWKTVWTSKGGEKRADEVGNTAPAVYKAKGQGDSDGRREMTCRFDPVEAREIWLTSPDEFYLGSIEVYNEKGESIALLSKGCGVTASAEQHLFWLSEQTQAALWQMQYDLGIKWVRVNYYLTPLLPQFAARDGKYEVDPYCDALITQATERGIEVCLTISAPAEPEYYRFLVRHFRDRVQYFEIFNEFYNQDSYGKGIQGPADEEASRYVELALPAAKIIREEAPTAKIVMGGPCPLASDWILACLRKGMAPYVDVLSWHPYSFPNDTDDDYAPEELDRPRSPWAPEDVSTYADSVMYLRTEAAKLGFRGSLIANEAGAYAIHANRTSQLIAAKYLARSAVLHASLGIPMLWNETTSLLRPSWQPFWNPAVPDLKPAYSYYVLRTLCTLLDGAKPEAITVQTEAAIDKLEAYGFALPGNAKLVAVWIREKSRKNRFDDYAGVTTSVLITAGSPSAVVGVDLLNGREQDLSFSAAGGRVIVSDLVIKDYPLFVRLEYTAEAR
jgi:hypothetical protein